MFLHTYTGVDGKSHAKEYDDPPMGLVSADEAGAIRIWFDPPGNFTDWHPVAKRSYSVTLSGEGDVGYGDGTKKRIKPGDIHFQDDTSGQGHTFRVVGNKPKVTLMIPVS